MTLLTHAEELLDRTDISRAFVVWQAVDENASVLLFQNAVIEQDEKPAVMQ